MRKRQRVLLAVTTVASLAVLTGCGNAGGGGAAADVDFSTEPTGTLNAWGFENADDVGTSRLDYAAEQLPDIDIEIDATAFDAQKFTASTASGQIPDVVQMSARFVGTYAARGLVVPLDECFAQYDVDADHWCESVMGDVTYDDKIYAVPQFYQPPAIIVNTPLLEAAGLTPDDIDTSDREGLLAAVTAMYKESGGNPSTLGLDPALPGNAGLWMLGAGGTIIDDDGAPTIDDPTNVETLTFLKELVDAQGGYAKVKSFIDTFDTFGAENQYGKNQVAGQVNQQWYPNVLAENSPELNIAAVPFKDTEGNNFTVSSGTAFVIPVGAKNPAAACAWMLNLTSTDAWMAAGKARADNIAAEPGRINIGLFTGSPEADQKIRDEYVVPTGSDSFDQIIGTYYDVVGSGQSYGSSAAGLEIQTELENAVVSALNGEKTPEEALADGQSAAQRAYDEAIAAGGGDE